MKVSGIMTVLPVFCVSLFGLAILPKLQADNTDLLEVVAVGTTGYAVQATAFDAPAYTNYNLSAFTSVEDDGDLLTVNQTGGGFSYDGSLLANFVKEGDSLHFESAVYSSLNELYQVYPLGKSFLFNFLYDGSERVESGTRESDPTPHSMPLNPGYITSATASVDTPGVLNGYWENGNLVLDVTGKYHLSFSQFVTVPLNALVDVWGGPGDNYYEAHIFSEGNLAELVIDGSNLVAGHIYQGEIEIFYGTVIDDDNVAIVDFKRSITTFTIEAVPEPSTYALWVGLLVGVAALMHSRRVG